MKIEEIILHFFIFTVLVVIGILTIQVWHYLKSKPLGLQTILDDLAKESFTVFGLALVLNWNQSRIRIQLLPCHVYCQNQHVLHICLFGTDYGIFHHKVSFSFSFPIH